MRKFLEMALITFAAIMFSALAITANFKASEEKPRKTKIIRQSGKAWKCVFLEDLTKEKK